ncbi:BREX-1 system adenine-specific DNA-methyltransferase PglX [uncultured Ruminococcus sp.]|uniref:BREX-1 system adenine-specific DNA-methyltransferase PglX n=1 Tax=uncultured Ruminococcus sp. TaxID=165186 RepID=UPI0025F6B3C2|nr:BREX-1 system adenine-specific DNA-methyltransferase PglX [uncultured Ruminococcus sp.]
MNKTAIKNFAIAARLTLIDAVTQRAYEYEVTENGKNNPDQTEAGGQALTPTELSQRRQLIDRINQNGFAQTMEEAAYTWFNRFIALRFMEVNGYLPSRIRVFTDETGAFKPEILAEASRLDFEGIDHDYIMELLDTQENDKLYKYLLIAQCNTLNAGLPEMFEEIGGWTELVFPSNLLRADSVIAQMVDPANIPEEDWKDQVQIIGWLYQYYISEPKDTLINARKAYKRDDIPFVTQLFTSDWIVRYMVENTLGRLWIAGHGKPECADWKFYLEEAEQEDSVKAELEKLRTEYKNIQPEQIKVIDPCMGSGHILVYAFDVLMDIYTSCGWSERDAALSILQHNLYGLDIDRRAYQLAYFAVMMKARQYNRSIIKSGEVQPQLANFADVMGVDTRLVPEIIREFADQFAYADTYGSLIEIKAPAGLDEAVSEFNVSFGMSRKQLDIMLRIHKILSQKYDVVVTNPPYMNSSYMPSELKDFIQNKYTDYKSDLFSAFMIYVIRLCKENGHIGLLTPYVWMFISSYEKLRERLYSECSITSLVQLEYNAFESACVPVASFTLHKSDLLTSGEYIKLSDFKGSENQEPRTLVAVNNPLCGYRYTANQKNFSKIPGMPVAYWLSPKNFSLYTKKKIGDIAKPCKGIDTGDNNSFLRLWFEINNNEMLYPCTEPLKSTDFIKKWYPYNKGGAYRRWYGNNEYLLYWGLEGTELKNFKGSNLRNKGYYFRDGLTWSTISSGQFSIRRFYFGYLFDNGGCCLFSDSDIEYFCGLLNSNLVKFFLELSPTLNYQPGDIGKIPTIFPSDSNLKSKIEKMVKENIDICKDDWNDYETSWDFEQHPLV